MPDAASPGKGFRREENCTASASVMRVTESDIKNGHDLLMDHYKIVVMDYLQSDRAVFLNRACRLELGEVVGSEITRQHCLCDAVAIDLRHAAVYLCDTALDEDLPSLMKKLAAWTRNWDSIKATLQRDCKIPANWRVHVWLFVSGDSIELLDERLEQLRQTVGARFKVKLTALEEVQPWRLSRWKRCEEAWETEGKKVLN